MTHPDVLSIGCAVEEQRSSQDIEFGATVLGISGPLDGSTKCAPTPGA